MSNTAIKVENLSKSYLVGHNAAKSERYTALRDVIARNARDLARKTRDMIAGRPIIQGDSVEEFWALKDVSFEVKHGETLGIIGRNGAGKSTLLKILSRITEPTKGRITLNGRVASLLEVGTGFHPELSGRENIFLNGAILGMSRTEIQRKFDEIVAFAEVDNFLDTPVKRYSSGMYVRLAFAVAAHLEPEILVVDEVLAVGDAQFQKKCLGKMENVANEGRTVLFVSHNLTSIRALCNQAILLESGGVSCVGTTDLVLDRYMQDRSNEKFDLSKFPRKGEGKIRVTDFRIDLSDYGKMNITFGLESSLDQLNQVFISASVSSLHNGFLFNCPAILDLGVNENKEKTRYLTLVFRSVPLAAGVYEVSFFCEKNGVMQDWIRNAWRLTIPENHIVESKKYESAIYARRRGVLIDYLWEQHI